MSASTRASFACPVACSKRSSTRATPERCLEAYYLYRTPLEMIAERKVRSRQLTEDGNVEISGRDLRGRGFRSSAEMHAQAA